VTARAPRAPRRRGTRGRRPGHHALRALVVLGAALLCGPFASAHPSQAGRYRGRANTAPLQPGPWSPPQVLTEDAARLSDWSFWWGFNRDAFMDATHPPTRSDAPWGAPGPRPGHASLAVQDAWQRSVQSLEPAAIDALESVLTQQDPPPQERTVAAAMIALARIHARGPAHVRARLIESLVVHAGSVDGTLHRAAIIGLGVLGDERAYPRLITLLRDSASGRYLPDRRYRDGQRAFAAYALAVLDRRAPRTAAGIVWRGRAVDALLEMASSHEKLAFEMRAASLQALGLIRIPWESSDADVRGRASVVEELLAWLDPPPIQTTRPPRRPVTVAQVPITIARLMAQDDAERPLHAGAEALRTVVLERMVELAACQCTEVHLRRSATIAIGVLGAHDARAGDPDLLLALRSIVSQDLDEAAVSFALMSIGQLGEGYGTGLPMHARDASAEDFLLATVRGSSPSRAAWAALALGVRGHAAATRGEGTAERVAKAICARFLTSDEPRHRGAFAIALGLLGDRASAPIVHEALKAAPGAHPDHLRGELCHALVLLGKDAAPGSTETLLRVHDGARRDVLLARMTAEALGHLPSSVASQPLLETVRRKDPFAGGAAARGLGRGRDRVAVALLIDVARGGGPYPDHGRRRASACTALGIAFGDGARSFNDAFARDANYLATPRVFVTHDRGHRFGLVDFH